MKLKRKLMTQVTNNVVKGGTFDTIRKDGVRGVNCLILYVKYKWIVS